MIVHQEFHLRFSINDFEVTHITVNSGQFASVMIFSTETIVTATERAAVTSLVQVFRMPRETGLLTGSGAFDDNHYE